MLNNITRLQQQQHQHQQLEQQQKKIASSVNLAKVSSVYDPNNNNGWFDSLKNDRDRDILKGMYKTGFEKPVTFYTTGDPTTAVVLSCESEKGNSYLTNTSSFCLFQRSKSS